MEFKLIFHKKSTCKVFNEKGDLIKNFGKLTLPEEIDRLKELEFSDEDVLIFISKSLGLSNNLYLSYNILPFYQIFQFFYPLIKSKVLDDIYTSLFKDKQALKSKTEGIRISLIFQKLINKISKIDNRVKDIIINLTDGTPIYDITKIVSSEFSSNFKLEDLSLEDSINEYLKDRTKRTDKEIIDAKIEIGQVDDFFKRLNKRVSWGDYEDRPGQIEMSKKISDLLGNEQFLVVEAGTGVGKSLAYLVPGILYNELTNKQLIISTKTKTLQEQLYNKDIPHLLQLSGKKITYTIAKGRSNYLCLRKLFQMLRNVRRSIPLERYYDIARTLIWVFDTKFGDVNEIFEKKSSNWIKNKLKSFSIDCLGKRCKFSRSCFIEKAKRSIRSTDIVIVNHALFFAGINIDKFFPDLHSVVFDEAHSLEEIATDAFGMEIALSKLLRVFHFLFHFEKGYQWGSLADVKVEFKKLKFEDSLSKVDEFIKDLEFRKTNLQMIFDEITKLYSKLNKGNSAKFRFRITELNYFDVIKTRLEEIKTELSPLISGLSEIQKLILKTKIGDLTKYSDDLELKKLRIIEDTAIIDSILDGRLKDFVYILEVDAYDKEHAKLTIYPIDVGDLMNDLVYPKIGNAIFTSATLSVGNNFRFFEKRIGLDQIKDKVENLVVPSPFDYKKNSRVIVPVNFPDPRHDSFNQRVTDILDRFIDYKEGRMMVLFTSYYMLNQVYEMLGSPPNILAQGISGSRESILRRFKEAPEAKCIFGTSSFWEGIDLPGNILTSLIIVKIPFPVPTDPLIEAKSEALEKQGLNPFMELSLPIAGIKLKQGFGRLIRRKTDKGIIAILDTRLRTKRYGSILLSTLPSRNFLFLKQDLTRKDVEI